MTLSLDDVRNKRFRMARKSGYEVLEVDEFVDEVEEAFAQLVEENQNLKNQVQSLKSTGSGAPAVAAATTGATSADQKAAPGAVTPIVVTTGKEASSAVVRLVEMSTEQAERLVNEAQSEADQIREQASASAQQVTAEAKSRAEQAESEARSRAQKLDQEIEARRAEMFGQLEQQRDELSAAVTDLRQFESTYRSSMVGLLRKQIEAVESGQAEPAGIPQLARDLDKPRSADASESGAQNPAEGERVEGEAANSSDAKAGAPASDTPRLDALLGDQR